jgi:hypothetical protein
MKQINKSTNKQINKENNCKLSIINCQLKNRVIARSAATKQPKRSEARRSQSRLATNDLQLTTIPTYTDCFCMYLNTYLFTFPKYFVETPATFWNVPAVLVEAPESLVEVPESLVGVTTSRADISKIFWKHIMVQRNVSKMIKPSLRGRLTRSNPLITNILNCFASLAMTTNH